MNLDVLEESRSFFLETEFLCSQPSVTEQEVVLRAAALM